MAFKQKGHVVKLYMRTGSVSIACFTVSAMEFCPKSPALRRTMAGMLVLILPSCETSPSMAAAGAAIARHAHSRAAFHIPALFDVARRTVGE